VGPAHNRNTKQVILRLSSLHIAVETGKAMIVESLLGHDANVHLKGGAHAETPFHIAKRIDEAQNVSSVRSRTKSCHV
jgi:hypothetical protein